MKRHAAQATEWIYQGLWRVLVDWFRVPEGPPSLPAAAAEKIAAFQPAAGYLRYLKFTFWVALVVIDVAIFIAWLVVAINWPIAGAVLLLPALVIAVVPDVLAYVAIHLRYDTTWYVLSERSLRLRRGVWSIHETTITYDNIQNVEVQQGPLQRWFGIADVRVETAGGGGSSEHEAGKSLLGHRGLIEGVSNAHEIRDLILAQLRRTRHTGLGDQADEPDAVSHSSAQLQLLREIRDLARAMARAGASTPDARSSAPG